MRGLGMTVRAAMLAVAGLLPAQAHADDARKAAAQILVGTAFPVWLAQAGGFTPDMAAVRSASERSVAGLASQLPESCDVARMKRDVCGVRPVSVSSSSMAPTLQVREVLAVATGDFAPLRRGDLLATPYAIAMPPRRASACRG